MISTTDCAAFVIGLAYAKCKYKSGLGLTPEYEKEVGSLLADVVDGTELTADVVAVVVSVEKEVTKVLTAVRSQSISGPTQTLMAEEEVSMVAAAMGEMTIKTTTIPHKNLRMSNGILAVRVA